ncbi:hypothetical protein BASA62_000413 [Batrachochytrium salamandrivorans]|nr:hypothetical protein BASA62_000413 [Batrachochytrium salamandrivorans]
MAVSVLRFLFWQSQSALIQVLGTLPQTTTTQSAQEPQSTTTQSAEQYQSTAAQNALQYQIARAQILQNHHQRSLQAELDTLHEEYQDQKVLVKNMKASIEVMGQELDELLALTRAPDSGSEQAERIAKSISKAKDLKEAYAILKTARQKMKEVENRYNVMAEEVISPNESWE